jgi:hypothetical protein
MRRKDGHCTFFNTKGSAVDIIALEIIISSFGHLLCLILLRHHAIQPITYFAL